MSRPWERIHFQLSTALPVRTHYHRPPPPERQTGRPIGNKPHHRRQKIRELLAQGVKRRHMAAIVGISRTAVQRHLRAIKREELTNPTSTRSKP